MTEKEYNALIKEAGKLAIEELEKETLKHLNEKPLKYSKKFDKKLCKTTKSKNKYVDKKPKKC